MMTSLKPDWPRNRSPSERVQKSCARETRTRPSRSSAERDASARLSDGSRGRSSAPCRRREDASRNFEDDEDDFEECFEEDFEDFDA